jgi:divalent metal cation (Fe/Co/Zn/Cd) transporter
MIRNFSRKSERYKWALILALITIFYNIVEGIVSILLGLEDETLSLFGFGLDSFVEVLSGIGILHMVRRLRKNRVESPDKFERRALKITGSAFYLLAIGLMFTGAINLLEGHHPETTLWGVVVATVSILTMWALMRCKIKVGRELDSPAILADANCTRTCMYLSFVLLFASAGYEVTGIGGLDSIGAIFIAGFSIKEGRESFAKAKGLSCCLHRDDETA